MKSFALIATAAAIRLSEEVDMKIEAPAVTAAKVFDECNTDGDNDLDYKEILTCMKKHGVPENKQKAYGSALLKYAFIPETNWDAVAEGISKSTGISEAAASEAIEACDNNGNNKLSYKEVG